MYLIKICHVLRHALTISLMLEKCEAAGYINAIVISAEVQLSIETIELIYFGLCILFLNKFTLNFFV